MSLQYTLLILQQTRKIGTLQRKLEKNETGYSHLYKDESADWRHPNFRGLTFQIKERKPKLIDSGNEPVILGSALEQSLAVKVACFQEEQAQTAVSCTLTQSCEIQAGRRGDGSLEARYSLL